jgi:hypothetical protein
MLVKYYKKSKEFDIDGGYNYGNLYSSFKLPKEYRDRNILTDLNIEYNVVEFGDTIIFDSSPFYDFFKYEDDDIILISDNINSILEEIKSFEVDYLSVSIIMTFGQVPLGRTMFRNIKSFKGNVYFEIDVNNNIYEFKKKTVKPNFDLFDKDYFYDHYKQKLEKIGDYTLFLSNHGTDSNFLKYVRPDVKFNTFKYCHKDDNYYDLFKTLNGIDIHSLNFPNEYHVWNNVDTKIVTGFGGDGTFAIKNYGDYTISDIIAGSGVNGKFCDEKDLLVLEAFVDGCGTLYDAREKCGYACSENTIPWSFKKSNSIVFNPLSDSVVRETFKYEPHDYKNRFLNKFVDFEKDITPFNMDYWVDFYSESIDKITSKYVYDKSDWEDNIYKQNNQMKFLVEVYYNSKVEI